MSEKLPQPTRKFMRPRSGDWKIEDIIDARKLRVQLTAAYLENINDEREARKNMLHMLHGALFRGRLIAQDRLEAGADGLDTANLLSAVMDEVLSALFDYVTTHVFRAKNPTEGERMAVLAVGGYGRGALAPSSDVDLLFLRTYKNTPWAESVIEYMLYALWDLGLTVGHSFRTVDECIRLSKEDITIRTAILDRRFLFGDDGVSQQLDERFQKDIINGRTSEFVAAKLDERDKRLAREGNSRYRVEPNVKEGKGGLRDLQTLFWLAKYIHGGQSFEDVLKNAAFTRSEAAVFRREARFLWTVRCHLHFVAGREEDRLSFDLQPELARRMGFADKSGMSGVERFMKRYFLAAKEVGALTRILCANLEAAEQKRPSGLRRLLPPPSAKPLADANFLLDSGRVSIANADVFKKDPLNLLRMYKVADEGGYDIHPFAMAAARADVGKLKASYRKNEEARILFLALATSNLHPGTSLKLMNETGVLGRFLPEFGRIVAQTQFNMYHHYTVDEHTIRAVEHMHDIESGDLEEIHPLATVLFPKIKNRRALYLAMLLHDTGKGQGDQQVEGAKTAKIACRRLGLDEEEADLVAWLVGNHLEMSDTAQRRDISDPSTIVNFAKKVETVERLRLLLILTVCDISAVGPDVWNSWKGQLLRELYYATEALLRVGRTDMESVKKQFERNAENAREQLNDRIGTVPLELESIEDAYWNTFDTESLAWHARTVAGAEAGIATSFRVDRKNSVTQVVVYAPDRPGLFADLCGVFSVSGANIISARLFARPDGQILDVFDLQDTSGEAFSANDVARLQTLTDTLHVVAREQEAGDIRSAVPVKLSRRQAAFIIESVVTIDNDASSDSVVIELTGRDRQGMMHEIAHTLYKHGLSIQSAHAESYGMKVHDVFYVYPEPVDKGALTEELLGVLRKGAPDAPRTPARELAQAKASNDR